VRVELLYFGCCPNWMVADERLARALTVADRDGITVQRHKVETAEEASGSGSRAPRPCGWTVVNPFATGRKQVGLACRVYPTPEGLSGSPTVEQFIEVLS